MSDPYPEVRDDESGIVPPQSGRNPDWPKKIRTLTAAELDRLTIDGSGRFYWDGKLVNYEPPLPPRSTESSDDRRAEPLDPSALDALDRAAYELGAQKNAADGAGALDEDGKPLRTRVADLSAVDLDVRPADPAQQSAADEKSKGRLAVAGIAPRIRVPEVVRLRLSFWQALGALIAVCCIAIGATGLAAYGFVAAHDWSCRAGLVQSYCPQLPAGRTRTDIPA